MEVEQSAKSTRGLTIYWDAHCPFCSAVKSRMLKFDANRELNFVDMNDPAVASTALPRFSSADLNHEMHVLLPDGTWRTGYFAAAVILLRLPAWSFLGRLMSVWVFADIGPKLYRWVAEHRYGISTLLRLPTPCDASGSCRI